MYKLNEDKICRFFAEMLLKATGKVSLCDILMKLEDYCRCYIIYSLENVHPSIILFCELFVANVSYSMFINITLSEF